MTRLNTKIIDQFRNDYITSDNIGTVVLILLALHNEDYDFLDELDDSNKDKKMIWLYRDLVFKNYLYENEDNEDSSNVHFGLTEKSINLISSLNDTEFKTNNEQINITVCDEEPIEDIEQLEKIRKTVLSDDRIVENWIDEWVELFPVRRADNYLLRNKGTCTNKMKLFLKNKDHENYTKDVIFKATKLYLEEQRQAGWRYTLVAGNFISKAESGRGNIRNSTLATYCDFILDGVTTNSSAYTDSSEHNPFV